MDIIYDKHDADYKECLSDTDKLKIANSWLRLDTLDYWRHNRMLNLLKPFLKKNEKWLTIGDGRYGSESAWLKRHGINCHASDMHTHLLDLAYKKGLIDSFSFQNAEKLDFESKTFDYVLIKETLHHLPRPWLALYEAYRVCKKGVIIIEPKDTFHNDNLLRILFIKFKNLVKKILRKNVYKDEYGFEEVGNFIYTVNNRELEKFLLGMHKTSIASNNINDHYFKGVENILTKSNKLKDRLSFLELRFFIFIKDFLCKTGFLQYSIGGFVLFKKNPSSKILLQMKKKNWAFKKLPLNPYL